MFSSTSSGHRLIPLRAIMQRLTHLALLACCAQHTLCFAPVLDAPSALSSSTVVRPTVPFAPARRSRRLGKARVRATSKRMAVARRGDGERVTPLPLPPSAMDSPRARCVRRRTRLWVAFRDASCSSSNSVPLFVALRGALGATSPTSDCSVHMPWVPHARSH